jgi:uncharacterized Fe-S cluster protein YjdI
LPSRDRLPVERRRGHGAENHEADAGRPGDHRTECVHGNDSLIRILSAWIIPRATRQKPAAKTVD